MAEFVATFEIELTMAEITKFNDLAKHVNKPMPELIRECMNVGCSTISHDLLFKRVEQKMKELQEKEESSKERRSNNIECTKEEIDANSGTG